MFVINMGTQHPLNFKGARNGEAYFCFLRDLCHGPSSFRPMALAVTGCLCYSFHQGRHWLWGKWWKQSANILLGQWHSTHRPQPLVFQTWGLLVSAYGQRTLLFLSSSHPTANLPLWICYRKPGLSDADAKLNLRVLGQIERIALLFCQAKGDTEGFCLENYVSP